MSEQIDSIVPSSARVCRREQISRQHTPKPASINRVAIKPWADPLIEDLRWPTHNLVTNNFHRRRRRYILRLAAVPPVNYDLGILMDEAVMEYIQQPPRHSHRRTQYAATGRITILCTACKTFSDGFPGSMTATLAIALTTS